MFSVSLLLLFYLIGWIKKVKLILLISLSSLNLHLGKQGTVTDGREPQRSFLVHTNIQKADKRRMLIVFSGPEPSLRNADWWSQAAEGGWLRSSMTEQRELRLVGAEPGWEPQLWGCFRFPLIDGDSSGKPVLVRLGPTCRRLQVSRRDVSLGPPTLRTVSKHLTPNPEFWFSPHEPSDMWLHRFRKMALQASHDPLLHPGADGGGSALTNGSSPPLWCHRGIKAPSRPGAALSRVSVPSLDASAGGTAVRRKNKTTRRRRPVVLFFWERGLSWSFWSFWPRPPSGESARLKNALWAAQAPLSNQVSDGWWSGGGSRRFWSGWQNLVLLVLVSGESQNSCDGSRRRPAGGPWLFKGISSRDIRCSSGPHAACQSGRGAAAGGYF